MFKTRAKLIWLMLLFAVACRLTSESLPPPTPIISTPNAVQSTPTLKANLLPTPFVTPAPISTIDDSIGDDYIPELGNGGYDVQEYLLQLSLNPEVFEVISTVTISAVATEDNLAQMWLDFVGFDISQVAVKGTAVPFTREEKKLVINLPAPLASGAPFTVVVNYRGQPIREASPYVGFSEALGLLYSGTNTIYTLSEPDGARYWFPCNDHPRDKARFRFEITVPEELTAVANGRLVETKQGVQVPLPGGGTGHTFVWEHLHPMASYLALVAVGPFERIEATSPGGIPLRHYVTAEYREEFEAAVSITGEAIDWMSELFGPYPFEAFGFVAIDSPPLALETQTMVIMSNDLIGRKTAVHELAHMWFGDWVGPNSWTEMWRKEGFATYIGMMWETRGNADALSQQVDEAIAAVAQNSPQYPIGDPPPQFLLGYNTYYKGAAFIHALRVELGEEAFFNGVRRYLQQYGGGTASDDDFRAIMEEEGGRSLVALFDEWLE